MIVFPTIARTMERAIPILPANDLAAARALYVDGLGFRVTFEASAEGALGCSASSGALSN